MKKFLLYVMVILLAGSLTACKSPSDVVAEKVGEKIVESAIGSNVDLDGDKVTIKGEDGTEVTMGGTEWPNDKLGKTLPKMERGTVNYVANSDALCMIMVENVSKADFEDYLSEVKKDGYTENGVNFSDASITSYLADNGKGVSFQLTYDSEKEELSITVGKQSNDSNNPVTSNKNNDQAIEDLGDALAALATPGWPKGKISDKIPEYPYGKVINSGDFGDGEYALLISPTTKGELSKYLALLGEEGFTLSNDDGARLGTLTLDFQFNTSDTLQMVVFDAGSSKWPSLPGDVLPPDKGTLFGEADIPTLSDEDKASGHFYSAAFTLVDVTEDDCNAFIQKQIANGWEDLGGGMASREMVFDGVVCELMLQFVQFYDGQGDFMLEAWQK